MLVIRVHFFKYFDSLLGVLRMFLSGLPLHTEDMPNTNSRQRTSLKSSVPGEK